MRNFSHAAGESAEQEYPSTPPIMAPALPLPPETSGKGNQPRSGSGFSSGVRLAITPTSHAPMSSMAALWLARRPAEEFAPSCAEVVRNPVLKGSVLANDDRFSAAVSQHLSLKSALVARFSMTS